MARWWESAAHLVKSLFSGSCLLFLYWFHFHNSLSHYFTVLACLKTTYRCKRQCPVSPLLSNLGEMILPLGSLSPGLGLQPGRAAAAAAFLQRVLAAARPAPREPRVSMQNDRKEGGKKKAERAARSPGRRARHDGPAAPRNGREPGGRPRPRGHDLGLCGADSRRRRRTTPAFHAAP